MYLGAGKKTNIFSCTDYICMGVVSVGNSMGLRFIAGILIRAKRVSNCYMQEKKNDRLSVCLSGCSVNLGFSVEKLSWF